MTITELIAKLIALPDHEQIVMLATPDGPSECEYILQMKNENGIECVGLFDGSWDLEEKEEKEYSPEEVEARKFVWQKLISFGLLGPNEPCPEDTDTFEFKGSEVTLTFEELVKRQLEKK